MSDSKREKAKRPYLDVNLPRKLEPYLNEALTQPQIQKELEYGRYTKTPSGLGVWIITQYLIENTSYRFEHINTYEDRVTIADNKLKKLIDVTLTPASNSTFELFCQHDQSDKCTHVKYVLTLADVMKQLAKKGWKPK